MNNPKRPTLLFITVLLPVFLPVLAACGATNCVKNPNNSNSTANSTTTSTPVPVAKNWSAPVLIYGNTPGISGAPDTVSCSSASVCVVVDEATAGSGGGNEISYTGSTWSSPVDINGTTQILSVSCPSATFCMAVDYIGNAFSYDGSTWSSAANIDVNGLVSVSCPSATFCMAVDSMGNALSYDGNTWSSAANIDGSTS